MSCSLGKMSWRSSVGVHGFSVTDYVSWVPALCPRCLSYLFLLKPQHNPLSVCVKVIPSCPTLCNPMDCSPSGSFVHRIFQARILEWVAIPFSRGSSRPRNRTQVSHIPAEFFIFSATREAHSPQR